VSRIQKKISEISKDRIVYCDVGARGGLSIEWKRVATSLTVVAYEPEAKAAAVLKQSITSEGAEAKVYKDAVWSSNGVYPFYETKSGACSSLLVPNATFIDNFPFAEKFDIAKEWAFEVKTIDATLAEDYIKIDFLKIDVQGGTLDVLTGASETLESVFGLNLEAEFVSIYQGESLFGDIDKYVRSKGFVLIDLRPTYWRRKYSKNVSGSRGELIYADLFYLIDPDVLYRRLKKLDQVSRRSLLTRLIRCCDIYGLNDWIVNYVERTRDLFDDDEFTGICSIAKKGKMLSRLPDFKYRHFLGNILKDIADQLHAPSSRTISQDQGIAGMKRHFWFGRK